jgi:hypothetical protein
MTVLVRSTGVTREDMGTLGTEEQRRVTGRPPRTHRISTRTGH